MKINMTINTVDRPNMTENVTFDEIVLGQNAHLLRILTLADIQAFAAVSGDTNPSRINAEYASDTL